MKINKELLAIKSHYFLRYAGTAPLTMFLPLIVRSKGLSAQTVGVLWTVLAIIGLITNCLAGALADYFRAHRTIFLASLTSLTIGLVSMYWVPDLPSLSEISEDFSLASLENLTLHSSAFIANSSTLVLELEGVDPEMTVGEGQAVPLSLPPGQETMVGQGEIMSFASLVHFPQFWLICFALMVEQMGINTSVMITDAVCFQVLGSDRHLYGRQRMWGTIGMGLMAIVSGALIDIYSHGLPQKDYLPAIISCIIFMSLDLAVVARMKITYSNDHKLDLGEVGNTLIHPQVLLFLMTVCLMGVSLGILWIFKLMLVEDVALAWDSDFSSLKLLQGLVLGIETFFGEMPFFFLSGMIIERLGYTCVLTTSFFCMGLRCCLYYTVSNPWYFLLIELLNGVSYSLFQSVLVAYANHIAPAGSQATIQSIFKTSFITGLSTAGFVGGILYNSLGGSLTFLHVGVFDLIYVLVFLLLHFLINKYTGQLQIRSFAKEIPEVIVKELFVDKKCLEVTGNMATTHETTE